jgi:hypothetical protein
LPPPPLPPLFAFGGTPFGMLCLPRWLAARSDPPWLAPDIAVGFGRLGAAAGLDAGLLAGRASGLLAGRASGLLVGRASGLLVGIDAGFEYPRSFAPTDFVAGRVTFCVAGFEGFFA